MADQESSSLQNLLYRDFAMILGPHFWIITNDIEQMAFENLIDTIRESSWHIYWKTVSKTT